MFCLGMLQEKCTEYNREPHMGFVDLEKAYDTISMELIWHCLTNQHVQAYIDTSKDMYRDSVTLVATNAGATDDINVEVGPHSAHYCVLS